MGDKDDDENGKGAPGPGGSTGNGGQVGGQVTTPGGTTPAQPGPSVQAESAPQAGGQGQVLGQGGEGGPETAQVQSEESAAGRERER